MVNLTLVSRSLGRAFVNYPIMNFAFQGYTDAEQLQGLTALWYKVAAASSTYSGVVEVEDGNGAICWLPRNQYPLGLWKELKSGMITLPFQVGFRPLSRIVRHYHESEKYTLEHASANAGWICVVGVAPEGQGKGHCRRMMETAIDAMRAQGMDEIWLTTDKDVNVTIYKKLGFQVMTEKVISSSGVKSWTMKYV
ncbi:hypothetical protein Ae201684_008224 [Aphanomyces euteiches]|uniref:N-acetyltransferase domain-containing protein n=2 Tax=Aphanomyces euteiches TaxID=100861 RepID=A0A6G0X615_9STRA|nr:hypothetical protein Ae201684_008224 [Aphanomyces euteiches]